MSYTIAVNALQQVVQEVAADLSRMEWTVHSVIGFGLIGTALLLTLFWSYFSYLLFGKWLLHRSADPLPSEAPGTTMRKYFLPMLTRDPNEEFKPYLPYVGPGALGTVAAILMIRELPSSKDRPLLLRDYSHWFAYFFWHRRLTPPA